MGKLSLPEPSALDTEGTSGYRVELYLIPAAENGGVPEIVVHGGYGNIGTPMRAFDGRWQYVLGYGDDVYGASVRDALVLYRETLTAISDGYVGSEWTGSKHVGEWREEAVEESRSLRDRLPPYLTHYWDASDYLAHGGVTWEEVCQDAGVDVERDDDEAVDVISDELRREALSNEAILSNVEECVRDLRQSWREEREEQDNEED